MHSKLASPRLALDQRTARLEQALQACGRRLAQVPLRTWQFVIILLLVLWLSHSLARLFWMLVPTPVLPPAAAVVANTGSSDSSVLLAGVDINQLKSLELFGQANTQASSAEATPPPLEETETTVDTQLNLVLLGVIASNEEDAGRAIIAANGQQDVYAPGAELPVGQGVSLVRVMDQRIILNNNGQLESLWLHQDSADGPGRGMAQSQYVAPEPMASRSWSEESEYVQQEYEQPQDQPPGIVDSSAGQESGDASGVGPDPAAEISRNISDVVAMSIHREGGQVVGYKIRPGRNAAQFSSLGLQPDDIVTAVNGVPLNNPGKIMEIYRNMSNATSASLEIKRGGSVISVDIVLQ